MRHFNLIRKSYSYHYPSSLRAAFHQNIFNMMQESGLTELFSISEKLIHRYAECIRLEVAIARRPKSLAINQDIKDCDKRRIQKIASIMTTIRHKMKDSNQELKEAATTLDRVTTQQHRFRNAGMKVRTVLITGLNNTLRNDQYIQYTELLHLVPALDDLMNEQELFNQLLKQRTELKENNHLPNAHELRPKTEQCYQNICDHIHATLITNYRPEILQKINLFISSMNQLIDRYRLNYNQNMGLCNTAKNKNLDELDL